MSKTMIIKTTPTHRTRGFTLIEMLVVAALIAIFAGLAVFNIVEQLNREKEKAALAEARSIATAMSFAYDDLGFFPKLCFLRFGLDELKRVLVDETINPELVEYHGFTNPNLGNMINKNWGEKYMSGAMPEKFIRMQFGSGFAEEMDWPADPFKQPYVGYFVKIEPPPGNPNGVPVPQWMESGGDKANYFAGIVSYGRNKVPGLKWDEAPTIINNRAVQRLYTPVAGNERLFQFSQAEFTGQALSMLVQDSTDIGAAGEYTIREAGSDDKFFEF